MASLLTTVGTRIDLSAKDIYLLGRAPECDIVVTDPASSRAHARLRVEGERNVTIEDLGSRNGTYVNDSRLIKPVQLDEHSRIRIGTVTYMLSFVNAGQDIRGCESANDEQRQGATSLVADRSHLVGDGPPRSSVWTQSEFAGQIETFSAADVLRFVLETTSSGSLRFAFESGEGRIEFRGGALWDARTTDGLVGETALIALTAMTTGLFWLGPDPGPVQRTIFAPPPLPNAAIAAKPRSSIETSTATISTE